LEIRRNDLRSAKTAQGTWPSYAGIGEFESQPATKFQSGQTFSLSLTLPKGYHTENHRHKHRGRQAF